MSAQEQRYSEEYRPLSAWSYVLLSILYSIPVIGWLFLIIFTFNKRNINRRNYTRSYWYRIIPFIAIFIYAYSTYPGLIPSSVIETIDQIKTQVIETIGGSSKAPSNQAIKQSNLHPFPWLSQARHLPQHCPVMVSRNHSRKQWIATKNSLVNTLISLRNIRSQITQCSCWQIMRDLCPDTRI